MPYLQTLLFRAGKECRRRATPLVVRARYAPGVARTLVERLHNPRGRTCGCDPDCWCNRTALGRVVKWWFPARYFGLHHKGRQTAEWKRARDPGF